MARETRNRNAERSRQLLQRAFSELLAEKPFDKITVTDITARADLSRSTFYAHYESTTELLHDLVEGIMAKLFDVADTAIATSFLKDPEPVMRLVTDYLMQDESLFRTLVGTPAAESYIAYIKQSVIDHLLEKIGAENEVFSSDVELRLGVTYVTGGLLDICCAWLRGEYAGCSAEDVAAIAACLARSVSTGYESPASEA